MGKREELRQVTINVPGTLHTSVEQINPFQKGCAKPHFAKSGMREIPIHPVKDLFLVQRQDHNWRIEGSGIRNHIAKESNILPDVPARDPKVWSLATIR